MKYLENVIKETMRLFPAACMLARIITQEVKLRKNFPESRKINVNESILYFKAIVPFQKAPVALWRFILHTEIQKYGRTN